MARPSLLNERLILEFCEHVRRSGNIETAIALTGIGRETFFRWQRAVRQGKGNKLQKQLVREVDREIADYAERMEMVIQLAAKDHWQAAAWWLERRKIRDYGRYRLFEKGDMHRDEDRPNVQGAKFSLLPPAWAANTATPETDPSTADGSTSTTRYPANSRSTNSRDDS